MTKKEFALLGMALKTYYPKESILPNEQALELWFKQLADIPYNVAEAALNKWVALNKWSPTIADLREIASELITEESPEWGDAWETVLRAVRKYGTWNERGALESLDEITRQCVERMGFKNICNAENISIERANFRMIYEQKLERKKRREQIPRGVAEQIATIKQDRLKVKL